MKITQKDKDSACLFSSVFGVRLDGKPATIKGRLNKFATVAQIESALSCEFSWPAVKRILNKGGNFKT